MKKLLIILGIMVLTTTANVNIVACGSCKEITKTDLSGLSTTAIVTLGNTNKAVNNYENTLIGFLAQSNFSSLTINVTIAITNLIITFDLLEDIESLTFHNNVLYAGAVERTGNGKIDINNKTKDEIIDLGSNLLSLVFKDNDLYAGTAEGTTNGKLYKINITEPTPTKTKILNLDSTADGLVFKNNELYAGTLNGKIYKINVTNKTKNTIANLNQKIHSLTFHGNHLYVGCINKLYKIDF